MRLHTRIISIVTVLVLLFSSFAFAGAAAIVSPATNTIVYSDSLLVSIKVTEPKTIRVTVYEEKDVDGELLKSVDVSQITEADLAIVAKSYEPVVVAGSSETSTQGTVTQAAVLSNGTAPKKYTSVVYAEAATYTNTGEIGFYTKQISSIATGLYRVTVETLDASGVAVDAVHSIVAVKEKPQEKVNLFETQQTGALQFLQNLLKSLFR